MALVNSRTVASPYLRRCRFRARRLRLAQAIDQIKTRNSVLGVVHEWLPYGARVRPKVAPTGRDGRISRHRACLPVYKSNRCVSKTSDMASGTANTESESLVQLIKLQDASSPFTSVPPLPSREVTYHFPSERRSR